MSLGRVNRSVYITKKLLFAHVVQVGPMTSVYLMIGNFARVHLLIFQEKKLTSREVTRKKGSKFFVLHVQAD